jgi:hypothetical protein
MRLKAIQKHILAKEAVSKAQRALAESGARNRHRSAQFSIESLHNLLDERRPDCKTSVPALYHTGATMKPRLCDKSALDLRHPGSPSDLQRACAHIAAPV